MTGERRQAAALVYNAGALGDFITALPAIRHFAAHRGGSVRLLGKPSLGALDSSGVITRVDDAGGRAVAPLLGNREQAAASPELRRMFAGVRSALVFAAPRSPLPEHLRRLGIAEVLAHPPRPVEYLPQQPGSPGSPVSPVSIVHYHLAALVGHGLPPVAPGVAPEQQAAPPAVADADATRATSSGAAADSATGRQRLSLLTAVPVAASWRASAAALQLPPRLVCIAPGSGSRAKNWPLERFLAIADLARAGGHPVAWVVGPAEREWFAGAAAPTPVVAPAVAAARAGLPAGDHLLSGLPLTTLAAVLNGCRLYLGNDSGVSHLAAAVGAPTVALFGPTDPAVWAPLGRAVTVIDAGAVACARGDATAGGWRAPTPIDRLPVSRVLAAVRRALAA